MSNIEKYPKCHMRTSLGNCDPIGGFCTSVKTDICEALHKAAEPKTGEWVLSSTFTDSWGNEFAKVKCSHCGYETLAISRIVKDGNFCLNCGIRMLGEDGEKWRKKRKK